MPDVKRHILFLFILVLIVTVAVSDPVFAGPSVEGQGFPRMVQDTYGNRVRLKKPPERIISLAAGTTEVLFSLGVGDKIVAVTDECNYPPETKSIQKVGNLYLNYEKIVSLNPDLVVVEASIRPRAYRKLKKLNMPVLGVNSDDYRKFLESLVIIGKATGEEERGRRLKAELEFNLRKIARSLSTISSDERPKVFIEIWDRPLMTAGGNTFISYVVETAGGVNVCRGLKGYPQVSPETLLIRNPDVIILTTSSRKKFLSNRRWRTITAVRQGRVHYINPDLLARPTMRLFDSCRILYNWFYPEMASIFD